MTTNEEKLLELFRSMDETRQEGLLLCAEIMTKYADPVAEAPASVPAPDPVPVQTSIYHGDMAKTAQKAVVPMRYQMTTHDLDDLYYITRRDKDPFNAFCFAFDYGFVKGSRATRRGLVKAV